jgi:ATP phosphoribosyltransferase
VHFWFFELLDLNIAQCKLMVAASDKEKLKQDTLKIATKYVHHSKRVISTVCVENQIELN